MRKYIKESIQLHNELNPKLWDGFTLKEDVNRSLNDIIALAISDLNDNDIPITLIDVRLVGSNASYNYCDTSDIDLHLIVDVDASSSDPNVLNLLYIYFKKIFNETYDISIHGINVELYIEDIDSSSVSNGIYSILKNEWVKFPERKEVENIEYEDKVREYEKEYRDVLLGKEDPQDFLNKLYLLRKDSIVDGELSLGNLIFKDLREKGYIEKLKDLIHKGISDDLTLESLGESLTKIKVEKRVPYFIKNMKEIDGNLYCNLKTGRQRVTCKWKYDYIDVNDIVTSQEKVSDYVIKDYIKRNYTSSTKNDEIVVVEYEPHTYYLLDGNHRVNACIEEGVSRVFSKIYKSEDIRYFLLDLLDKCAKYLDRQYILNSLDTQEDPLKLVQKVYLTSSMRRKSEGIFDVAYRTLYPKIKEKLEESKYKPYDFKYMDRSIEGCRSDFEFDFTIKSSSDNYKDYVSGDTIHKWLDAILRDYFSKVFEEVNIYIFMVSLSGSTFNIKVSCNDLK